MRVFQLKPDYSRYQGLEPVNEEAYSKAYELIWGHDFDAIAAQWTAVRVRIPEQDRDARPTDYTTILADSSMRVFSRRAVEVLGDLG